MQVLFKKNLSVLHVVHLEGIISQVLQVGSQDEQEFEFEF